ncbi:MAG: Ethyl tert-butyl ether degradation EthD [Ilumatobacteraceae bacterium]|nr:Ethyl tert-butyl ether degradation EthD [Ilumatobacteraceae bacterium]
MQLFAFVKRKEGMSREDFLDYWHNQHGPMIRDTPALGGCTTGYVQHPAAPQDQSGWDGVAVQSFASWEDFIAMLGGPAGEMMREDEANFLDSSSIKVVFTEGKVVMIDPDAPPTAQP